MRNFLCLFCIFLSNNSYATSCEINANIDHYLQEYEVSDIVFFGQVIAQYSIDKDLISKDYKVDMNRKLSALIPLEVYKNPGTPYPQSQPYESIVFLNNITIVGEIELQLEEYYLIFGERLSEGIYRITRPTCGRSFKASELKQLEPFKKWNKEYEQKNKQP